MAVLTPFFDVVAGVAILAGRSSLLDRGVFKTANTNFTVRHLLALGFIGYGGWNLWKIERAQDKLKKTLDAESFGAEPELVGGPCEICDEDLFRDYDDSMGDVCLSCYYEERSKQDDEGSEYDGWLLNFAESFGAEPELVGGPCEICDEDLFRDYDDSMGDVCLSCYYEERSKQDDEGSEYDGWLLNFAESFGAEPELVGGPCEICDEDLFRDYDDSMGDVCLSCYYEERSKQDDEGSEYDGWLLNFAESFSADSRKHGGLKPQLEREPQGYWPGECLKCGLEDKDMDNVFSWSGNCKSCGTNESYGRYNQYIKKDAESFNAEDDDSTNCEVCEVKIGYDEAIYWENFVMCEECYEVQMIRDIQNYTEDETDCTSCGYSISPNDVLVELVDGLCPDCKDAESFSAEDNSYCANCLRAYTYDEEDDAYIMVEEGDEFWTVENYGVLCRECHPDFQHEDSFRNWTRKPHLAVRPYEHEKKAESFGLE